MLLEIICLCFMSAVWFKIISRIDIFMNVIQTRQATFDTGVANIQEVQRIS